MNCYHSYIERYIQYVYTLVTERRPFFGPDYICLLIIRSYGGGVYDMTGVSGYIKIFLVFYEITLTI